MTQTLKELLNEKTICLDLVSKDRDGVLADLAERIASAHKRLKGETLYRALLEREVAGSTAIGNGIAFPHIRLQEADEIILAFGRSKEGINFLSQNGKLTHFFVVLIAPQTSGEYLKILAKFSKAFQNSELCQKIITAENATEIIKILSDIA